MNLLVIGSDSFIARKFISYSRDIEIKCISRTNAIISNEVVEPDFFSLSEFYFREINVVLNFAAIVHQPNLKDEDAYNEVNYKLAILNAQKAKKAGVKLFIQMSTISVYGNATNISVNSPYSPQNPYGSSKLKADEELLKMQDESFKVALIRPPMVYGGGKAPGNMIRLIELANKGVPLPFKEFDNRRDFINVNNLVQYLSMIVEKQLSGIHLISDQEPVSTEYLLNCIYRYLGKKSRLIKVPNFCLKLLKIFRSNEYEKLFGTLRIETNFPYEYLIKRYSVEHGIFEMVESYKNLMRHK